jgi:signal transduction histidine kinase
MMSDEAGSSIGRSVDSSHPGFTLEHRKILIVSDDSAKVRNLRDILRPEGYLVDAVRSGEAVLENLPGFEPDLILLDVELADVDVFDISRFLRIQHGSAAPAVIFISSKGDPAQVVEGLAAGGVDYLSRPFREQEVLARVRIHLLNRLRLAQLKKNDKLKNRLLGMAAHDLRNPLVSIRTLTNLVRTGSIGPMTPKQREVLDTVYDASQLMLDLVNELLEVSVLETRGPRSGALPASLGDLVTASIRLNNATASEKSSVIELAPGPHLPLIEIDKPRIWQVLNNLLNNAIKFSPPGSLITVATELGERECAIAIRDQGPGIPEAERSRLFKDYSRTSVRPTGGEPSTGLGLSICRKVIEAHHGTIGVRNLPGGGAEFRITLPLTA